MKRRWVNISLYQILSTQNPQRDRTSQYFKARCLWQPSWMVSHSQTSQKAIALPQNQNALEYVLLI
ncbi:MAG: hypothetical protein HC836_16135 [Richelia sp. RM2_1_2]|nr:hypothetical protein [Richelia sp. RM2_1_2]